MNTLTVIGFNSGRNDLKLIKFAEKHPNGISGLCLNRTSTKNHSINCLLSNKAKEPYKDHLCLFRALAMYMNGHNDIDCHPSRYYTGFLSKSGFASKFFRRFYVGNLPVVKGIIKRNIFIYDFDIQEGQ